MTIEEVITGPNARIVYLVEDDGSSSARDFVEGLDERWQKTLHNLYQMFCEEGHIRNDRKMKKETQNTYCLKAHQIRISCFLYPKANLKTLVLSYGFIKKADKMSKQEKKRAEDYFNLFTGGLA